MFSANVMSLLNKFIPVHYALKGLERISPRMKSFITGALGAGYGANEIIEYLREKSQTSFQTANREHLQQRVAEGSARPDEEANLERLNQSETPGNILQGAAAMGAAALGGGVGAGLGMGAEALSQGAKAIAPNVGKIGQAASGIMPANAQKGMAAAPQMAQNAIQSVQQAPGRMAAAQPNLPISGIQNLIAQHPKVGASLDNNMNKGLPIRDAALATKSEKSLSKDISAIEKETGEPFENTILNLMNMAGQGQQNQPQQQSQMAQQQSPAFQRTMDILAQLKALKGM